jgi:hypothetical protein
MRPALNILFIESPGETSTLSVPAAYGIFIGHLESLPEVAVRLEDLLDGPAEQPGDLEGEG